MISTDLKLKIRKESELYFNKLFILPIQKDNLTEWGEFIKKVCTENDEGVISIGCECLYEDKMNFIINTIKKYNNNFKLHSSSITPNEFSLHPLTIVSLLHTTSFINDLEVLKKDYMIHTEYGTTHDIFLYQTNSNQKNINYILSSRRFNITRESIFKNIKIQNPNGIIRYLNFDNPELNLKNNLTDYKNVNDFLSEYEYSYISFITETCVDANRTLGNFIPLTEKTLLGFYFKTLPIVFGCRGLNKLLLDNGFWTANELFNFDDTSDTAVMDFVELLTKIDKLSTFEIKKIYNDNIKNIENNHNLLMEIFNISRKLNPYLQSAQRYIIKNII